MNDLAVAAALLFSAAPVPDSASRLAPLVRRVALSQELMDPREVTYLLANPDDFKTDMLVMRDRVASVKDCPPLSDVIGLPSLEAARLACDLNRVVRSHWYDKQSLPGREGQWYRDRVEELDRLYRVWDLVRDARSEYYYVTVRRNALRKLRAELGETFYPQRRLPPPVPPWWYSD